MADPISAAISSVIISATAATGATATAITVATTIAVNVAIAATVGALTAPEVGEKGNPTDWRADPDAPIPFAAGRVGVAGQIVHREQYGPNNMYQTFVTIVSGAGPIQSFLSYSGDDQPVTFNLSTGAATSSQWVNEMWMTTQRGLQPTPSALTQPSGLTSSPTLPGWGSSYRLSGKAAYMLTMGENSKRSAYPTGEPKPLWVIEGLYGYDPRQDSTYPGGSGSCRLSDPDTWVYLTNPILWGLKWALGLWEGPTGRGAPQVDYQVGGIGAKPDGIDFPAFVSAANVADANGWTVAAYPSTADDKAQVLDAFLQAGGAVYAQRAGKISCIQRAAPRTSIVTISAADTAGPVEIDTAASRISRINTIRPRFWSEANRWQMTAIDEVTASSYQSEDGAKRTRGVDFPYVPNATQCAQLAALQIANTREGIAGTIPLKPHLQRITPGDAFTITEPGFVLDGLKCLCMSTDYDPASGVHKVTFVSETDGKYVFALGQSPTPPVAPTLTPTNNTVTAPAINDWTIVPREATEDGIQLPVWDLVGSVTNDTATAVIVEWGAAPVPVVGGIPLADQIAWNEAYFGSPTATRIPIQGMQPGGTYYVAVRNVRGSSFSARTLYGPAIVPNLTALTSEDGQALDRLNRIDSDGWLTKGEKPAVLAQYQTALAEYPGVAERLNLAGLTTQLTAYNNATTTLTNYINALTPALTNFAADTVIVGQDLRYAFELYFTAKQLGIDALLADARTRAVSAAAAASAANADLTAIFSDGILTRNEKPSIIEKVAVIQGETAALRAQALAFGAVAQHDAYVAAYDALLTYLAGQSPAWNNLSVDTPLGGSDLRFAFQQVYLRRQEMLTAQMGITDAEAGAALSRLAIIDSDGWLSKGEKPQVVREYEAIIAQFGPLRDQAATVGATTERTALIAAVDALNLYLGNLTPVWSDSATDTPIVGANFRAAFTAYYQAAQNAQTAITAAVGQEGSDALDRVLIIDSDNWLSRGEKSEVIRLHQTLNGEFAGLNAQAVALGITDPLFAYFDALTALNSYLSGLSPAWNTVTVDTPIVGSTFRQKFNDVFLTRTALQNAMVDNLDDAVEIVIGRLDDIASDNILSRNEKPEVIRQWNVIDAEQGGVVARLAAVGVSSTAYLAAFNALGLYLASLSPAWNDLAQNTPIVGTTFRQKFVDYYVAKAAADNAAIIEVGADATAALAALDVIASDSFLSKGEKPEVIRLSQTLNGEFSGLNTQAVALGITTTLFAYFDALTALNSYLTGLSPAWDNLSVDTPIVGATFRSRFTDVYVTKQALQNAIAAKLDADIGVLETDLGVITSDNWLSRNEKPQIIREVGTLNDDYPGLAARAAAVGVSPTAHGNAVSAVNTYLNGLSPAWNTLTVDTPMVGATLRSLMATAYSTKQTLQNAIIEAVTADADAALADLAIIASDNWLSRVEKPAIIQQFNTINGDFPGLNTQAVALGITGPLFAHFDAVVALANYLNGLSPAYTNLSVDTPITGTTLRSLFETALSTKTALQTAMIGATGTAVFRVESSHSGRVGTRSGAGSVTTPLITLTPTGNTGSMTYAWERILGDAGVNLTAPSGASTAATGSVATGEEKQALFAWRATDSGTGITREGQVSFTLLSNV